MNIPRYRGDVTSDGVVPFAVAVRDGVNGDALKALHDAPSVILTDQKEAQAMLIRSKTTFLAPEDFARAPLLQYLVRVGVGTDNIDLGHAGEAGVATLNTPGASTTAVAQRAVALMLAAAARIPQATQQLRQRQWPKGNPETEPMDLSEKTLGIVGFGRIGQMTAQMASPFFRKVLFHDIRSLQGFGDTVQQAPDLDTLLRQSDVISLNVSGNEEILTRERLQSLRHGALLINTARGASVNKEALLERMENGGLLAALDVFWQEGSQMFDDPVVQRIVAHPGFIGTAHTAASDVVTQGRLAREAVERVLVFAQQGTINPHNLPGHTLPLVDLGRRTASGVRGILSHENKPGVLATITAIIARHGTNIGGLVNEQGRAPESRKLAMTQFDLEDIHPETALRIMDAIRKAVTTFHSRILHYA